MHLDPKAMSVAREAWIASDVSTRFFSDVEHCALEAAISAYLSSAIPGEVAELVERLRKPWGGTPNCRAERDTERSEAATALTSLAARIEALEAGLEEAEGRIVELYRAINPHANEGDGNRLADTDDVVLSLRAARLLFKKDSKA